MYVASFDDLNIPILFTGIKKTTLLLDNRNATSFIRLILSQKFLNTQWL